MLLAIRIHRAARRERTETNKPPEVELRVYARADTGPDEVVLTARIGAVAADPPAGAAEIGLPDRAPEARY
jgi:hypothetical protein